MKSSKSIPNTVQKNISDKEVRHIRTRFVRIASQVQDPRTRHIDYPLYEILFIAVVAVTCGATSYQQIETFGNVQEKWFKKFLELKNGIPSHDTFRRLFQLLNPIETLKFYQEMIRGLSFDLKGRHIAVDGKTSRGCYNEKGKSLLHLVSAYETESGISLMQLPTKNEEGKDVGEFNAIPKVLERFDIKDAVVTIDAGGCYAEITDAVTKGGADYIITLKENQPTVYATAESLFAESASRAYEGVECYRETSKGHGREEERTYYALPVPEDKLPKKWSSVAAIIKGFFRRTEKGKTTESIRYYISSLNADAAERIGHFVRSHWGIENGLHWILDVSMGEDGNRTRRDNGAENLSMLRRLALAILKPVKGKKTIPTLMFQLALDEKERNNAIKHILMR